MTTTSGYFTTSRAAFGAALLCAGLQPAIAGPCADPGPHGPTNNQIWTASTPTGINATHWYVDQTVRVTAIDMYLRRNSAGISFVVYESADNVDYTLIASTSTNQGGTGWEWHNSGPMDVVLQPGHWYAIGLHWNGTVTHSGSNAPAVTDLGWGTMIDGAYGGSVGAPDPTRTFSYGYWNPTQITVDDNVDADADGSLACLDCDDADPDNFPGNSEVCDGLDNDCDGAPDNGAAAASYWPDVDMDGHGDVYAPAVLACGYPPAGAVDNDDDCDDADPDNFPGNLEVCDGVDNDCSGTVPVTELDQDGDGYVACDWGAIPWRGSPSVTGGLDCDDTTALVSPAATDLCGNGLDDDCDGLGAHGPNAGLPGGFVDDDGDGFDYAAELLAGTNDCNPPPILILAPLVVDEGATGIVSSAQLAASDANNTPAELVYTVTAAPTQGGLFRGGSAVGLGGSFSQQDVDDGVVVYLHDGGEIPTDWADLTLSDSSGESLDATLVIDILGINDAPRLTTASLSVLEGSSMALGLANLVGTDAEDSSTALVYELTVEPTNGYVDLGPVVLHPGSTFTWTELEQAKVWYHHDASETTADSIGFRLLDTDGLQGPSATLEIAITPVNDRPTANPDSYASGSDGLDIGASLGVLANDVDPEQDTLSAIAVVQPLNGSLSLNADGSFAYTPNAGFSGVDQFTYTAADNLDESQPATVDLTVTDDATGAATPPQPKLGCGCTSTPTGPASWWLLGLGALALRRPRRP